MMHCMFTHQPRGFECTVIGAIINNDYLKRRAKPFQGLPDLETDRLRESSHCMQG
jgi:hypothetical protein